MLYNILKQLCNRISIVLITSCILICVEAQHINDIMLLILEPVKELHNDWYNNILHYVMLNAFQMFDAELHATQVTYASAIEYVPTCEITIQGGITNRTIAVLAAHLSIFIIIVGICYQTWLSVIPSLFAIEKKITHWYAMMYSIGITISVLLTHFVWTTIFLNITLHSYYDYNYYEFDVDFDLHSYVCKYIYTVYITASFLLCITTGRIKSYTSIICICFVFYVVQLISFFEIIYYLSIALTLNELMALANIFNKKRNNLYRQA